MAIGGYTRPRRAYPETDVPLSRVRVRERKRLHCRSQASGDDVPAGAKKKSEGGRDEGLVSAQRARLGAIPE